MARQGGGAHTWRDPRTRSRWALLLGFVLLTALILPKNFIPELSYSVGKLWVDPTLKAEFDFPILKTESELEADRRLARENVYPVFVRNPDVQSVAVDQGIQALDVFFIALDSAQTLINSSGQDSLRQAFEDFFFDEYRLNPIDLLDDHGDPETWSERFVPEVRQFCKEVYASRLLDTVRSLIRKEVLAEMVAPSELELFEKTTLLTKNELPAFLESNYPNFKEDERRLIRELVLPVLKPNLQYSEFYTREERIEAADKVLPVRDMVESGETIILKNDKVTEELAVILRSYQDAREGRLGQAHYLETFSGQIVLLFIVTFLYMLYIRTYRPRIFFDNRKLSMVLLLFFILMGLTVIVVKLTALTRDYFELNYVYLVPFCMGPIILTVFFDSRLALFGNLMMCLYAGSTVANGFAFLFIQIAAGSITVYTLNRLRNRGDFFLALLFILIAYSISYMGYSFFAKGSFFTINYGNLILLVLNVLLTLITYPLIYVFEKVFGMTSDLTYIELLDTNHPLLKEMGNKAPGTFQHSLQVANIAEAVLNRIGGNGLHARVGALFHDIGKMKTPEYFIENVRDDENPHDKLPYTESAQIIISHVTEGVELAQAHDLPSEVIDFIRTHHGTTLTDYFYRKHCAENPDGEQDKQNFQYPGPSPFTREQAILMIADSCEAASRSMKDKSPEKIRGLVDGIVRNKVNCHQFDAAPLTFKDLETVKLVVYQQLLSIYHGRIEYPDAEKPSVVKA